MNKLMKNDNYFDIIKESTKHDVDYLRQHLNINETIEDHAIESIINNLKLVSRFHLVPKCQGKTSKGGCCSHTALPKYQMRFCGIHKKQYAIWARDQDVPDMPVRHCVKVLKPGKVCMERCSDIMHQHCDKHMNLQEEQRFDVETMSPDQEQNRNQVVQIIKDFPSQTITEEQIVKVEGKCSSCFCPLPKNSKSTAKLCKECSTPRCCHTCCFGTAVVNSEVKGFQYCDLHYYNAIKFESLDRPKPRRITVDTCKIWASTNTPIESRLEEIQRLLNCYETRIKDYERFAYGGIVSSFAIERMADNYNRDRVAVKDLYRAKYYLTKEISDNQCTELEPPIVKRVFKWKNWDELYQEKKRKRHYNAEIAARYEEDEEEDPEILRQRRFNNRIVSTIQSRSNLINNNDDSDDSDSDSDSEEEDW